MKLINYVEPGAAGANQVWDFSGITPVNDFTGSLQTTMESENPSLFSAANVELNEFGNKFYFKLTKDALEQYGMVTASNDLVITYDKPFKKMEYPFSYDQKIDGAFTGSYKLNNTDATLNGNYSVYADAYGTLMLPNDVEVENTLRVKTIKSYDRTYTGGQTNHIDITTYRWYASTERFPLLVLTTIDVTSNGSTSTSTQAAYRPKISATPTAVLASELPESEFKVFPNPYRHSFEVTYVVKAEGSVDIAIYDLAGKRLHTLVNNETHPIFNGTIGVEPSKLNLTSGMYLVKATINGASASQKSGGNEIIVQ
ncbi:MAG: T9SS type A sorting domain-containing protein [Bacteroidales bacterium]|nr:T9SS type A sorting domain-containing protein [Bacteroidales bacterium]